MGKIPMFTAIGQLKSVSDLCCCFALITGDIRQFKSLFYTE